MSRHLWIHFLVIMTLLPLPAHAEDLVKEVQKAIERSTLDQPGTKPFHLKAVLAPSFERDKDTGYNGDVEIWWASPTQWRREIRSKDFHQMEIVNGSSRWQKNEGDYYPEWLRETAIALTTPVPPLDEVLDHVQTLEAEKSPSMQRLKLGRATSMNWTTPSGTDETPNLIRTWISFDNTTGLLLYGGGLDWSAEFKDYADFHGRMVARTVNVGSPQVTAKVVLLEELGNVPPALFDTKAAGSDPQILQTIRIDERTLRKNLVPTPVASWPPVQDGPFEGKLTTKIVVDREGIVRSVGTMISDNPELNDAGAQVAEALRFHPFLSDGMPVQVISQITFPFKTSRPAGSEAFDSARTYFERGRHAGFPASGNGTPYMLRAEFSAKSVAGNLENGRYEDTWMSDTQWRREEWFAKTHYVRSRNGEQTYQFAEGPDESLLRTMMDLLEPIPALDTFVESDWKIKRDTVDGVRTIRVLAGYESPEGKLDPEQARGYWFDETGSLVKTYTHGIESRRLDFQEFAGVKVAHRIDVLKDGALAAQILVTDVSPVTPPPASMFEVKGHEWYRAFTHEMR